MGASTGPPLDPSCTDADVVAGQLDVDPARGLTSAEASRRLAEFGPNVLRAGRPEPLWHKIVRQFQDPLVYLLLIGILISLVAWAAEGWSGFPVDAVVIAAVVVANAVIGLVQQARAADAVAALADLTAPSCCVLRDGRLQTIPAAELVPGDVLALAEGDAVGADARIVECTDLRVLEAALTGESAAVGKHPRSLSEQLALGDRTDMVFGGTAVVQGVGRAVVTATGMVTQIGKVAGLLADTPATRSPLQREIAAVSKALGLAVVAIAVVVMVAVALLNGIDGVRDAVTLLLLGVSLAVAAVPEGLPAILSLVLAIGVRSMARRNAVVKQLYSVETLGSASVICSDKTGTLTRNEMTLRRVATPSGIVEFTGVGYSPDGHAEVAPRAVQLRDGAADRPVDATFAAARRVVVGGALANNTQLREDGGRWSIHGDPTEAAFLVAVHKIDGARERVARFRRAAEIPFTSERRLMSTVVLDLDSAEQRMYTKGAPDVLLPHCTRVRVGDDVVAMTAERRLAALADVDELSGRGYRTLGVAYRMIDPRASGPFADDVEEDLVYLGVVGIIDPPRAEARAAVEDAQRAGVRVLMITGDHPRTAAKVAADLGIAPEGEKVLTGAELDRLDAEALAEAVRDVAVYARVAPEHKLRIVDALQSGGHVVAMTGDGVNDAPALKAADIGVAMGRSGTEVTKQAGSMILGDDNFATIVAAVRHGRVVFDNIAKSLRYLLSSNFGEVLTVFLGVVLAGAIGLTDAAPTGEMVLPLLATQILWINLVTDSGPALAMGLDPELDDVMARPPRRPTDRILGPRMWATIVVIGVVMAAAALVSIDAVLPGGLVPGSADLTTARTAGFTTLVLAQLFNALNSRCESTSALRHPFVNRWLWGSIALSVGLQIAVVHVPALQVAFGTAPLSADQWALTVGLASTVLWVGELEKALLRARTRRRATAGQVVDPSSGRGMPARDGVRPP